MSGVRVAYRGGMTGIQPPSTGLERLFRVDAIVGPVEDYGITSAGHRRVVAILGGRISDGLDADILPGGADWQILRDDGTLQIDTRYSARMDDGCLLHIRTQGVRAGDPAVLEAILRGEEVAATEYYFRVAITIETSCADHADLQRTVMVGSAARSADRVVYDAYRVL